MNNTFNLQRFVWLFNKHTKEHFKRYLMSLAVLAGLLALVLGYITSRGALDSRTQFAVFGILLAGMGFVFTSSIFSELSDRQKSASVLMLPVAHLERFLVAWLYSFIIFQIVYIVVFLLINGIFVGLGGVNTDDYRSISLFGDSQHTYFSVLPYYCFVHSFSFLGAMVFKKAHFIKTAFIFLLFLMGLMLSDRLFSGFIFEGNVRVDGIPFSGITISEANNQRYYLNLDEWFAPVLTVIVVGSAVSLWAATYFKLKEKQV